MPFILQGHPDNHGGAGVKPPVLVYFDGNTAVFKHPDIVQPDEVLFYDLNLHAELIAETIPGKMQIVEVITTKKDDKVVNYSRKDGGLVKDHPGKSL